MVNLINIKQNLEENLRKNCVILEDLTDIDFDTKHYLNKEDTIIFYNCKNIKIKSISNINRLEFKKCTDIYVDINLLISGIQIEYCNDVSVKANILNSVTVSKSRNITIESKDKTYVKDIHNSKHILYN